MRVSVSVLELLCLEVYGPWLGFHPRQDSHPHCSLCRQGHCRQTAETHPSEPSAHWKIQQSEYRALCSLQKKAIRVQSLMLTAKYSNQSTESYAHCKIKQSEYRALPSLQNKAIRVQSLTLIAKYSNQKTEPYTHCKIKQSEYRALHSLLNTAIRVQSLTFTAKYYSTLLPSKHCLLSFMLTAKYSISFQLKPW